MPKVLLVAATTGYQTRSFAEAGRRLGLEMILATDRCHILDNPWGDQAVPVRFEQPVESAGQLAELTVDAVVAVGDRPAWIASLAAEALGLPFHPPAAVEAAGDKQLARERFAQAGLLVPAYYHIRRDRPPDAAQFYPCVLKPLGLSASRGVIRANNDTEFQHAAARIRRILQQPEIERLNEPRNRVIQVEEFIEGREFALEGLVTNGQLRTLALFDKPDPLDGPYFEETTYLTPSREIPAIQAQLKGTVQQAVTALGLSHGPIHAEMRFSPKGVFILEVAARPIGGLCSKVLTFGHGLSLEEMILRHALGDDPGAAAGESLPGGVMMLPIPKSGIFQNVSGLEQARKVPGILDIFITAKPGQELVMLPEGASYLGFLFASGIAAEAVLTEAHKLLSFEIQTSLNVMNCAN